MYKTILTSQGTITLPAALRRKYNLQPGETLVIGDEGGITVSKPLALSDVRARNMLRLQKKGKAVTPYTSGDGFAAHIKDTYGKK